MPDESRAADAIALYRHLPTGRVADFRGVREAFSVCGRKAEKDFQTITESVARYTRAIERIRPEMLLFGDSVVSAVDDPAEDDTRPLKAMLAAGYPATLLSFDGGAFSSLFYRHLFPLLPAAGAETVVLLEFNLRSLSDEWFLRPSYQFPNAAIPLRQQREQGPFEAALEAYFQVCFTDSLWALTRRFQDETLKASARGYRAALGEGNDFHYCVPADWIAERMQGLLHALDVLHAKGYAPIVFLTPIPHQRVAPANASLCLDALARVREVLRTGQVCCLDMSLAFPLEAFTASEHLRCRERRALAEAILRFAIGHGLRRKSSSRLRSYSHALCGALTPAMMKQAADLFALLD